MVEVQHFFDPQTFTLTYVVYDPDTSDAVILDPVLNFDPLESRVSLESVEQVLAWMQEKHLNLKMILETHAHADHLSSAAHIKKRHPGIRVAIGAGIKVVQRTFSQLFDFPDLATDGRQFDLLLEDGKTYEAGSLSFKVLATPGHTPACSSYLFADRVFVGDLIFMPDYGSGRCDFPNGSAEDSFRSITEKLFTLPGGTRIYVGHDYMPGGRELKFEASVDEQKKDNIHIGGGKSKEDFIHFRTNRDKELSSPKLLFPSVQFNINGGDFVVKNAKGDGFFKIPVR